MKYKAKHIAEYVTLRMLVFVLLILPYKPALCFAWCNALISYYILHRRVKSIRNRIRSVFENKLTESEINNIAWQSWRNIVFTGVEMVRAHRLSKQHINAIFDCEDAIATLKQHSTTGAGGVIALLHMGSWEMAAHTFAINGVDIFGIAANQRNPLTSAYIKKLRRQLTSDTVNRGKSSTLRQILRLLKKGKFLGILPDVRARHNGIPIDFLGGTASIGKGMARFARHANVPIFPCIITRNGWYKHKITLFPAICSNKKIDKEEDITRITTEVMKIFSDTIIANPEQWFWYNKRWILDPVTNTGSNNK